MSLDTRDRVTYVYKKRRHRGFEHEESMIYVGIRSVIRHD